MCGICGYISTKEYSEDIIRNMNDTMIHRGPDDSGVYLGKMIDGRQIALGQRRLSILDLTEAGHQPMISDDGNNIIVYNGEVYNFQELRKELIRAGYQFHSDCDTEVVLKAYEAYDLKFLDKLNGMFAIAIYDLQNDTIILARDRMGKKPLYYYFSKEDNVFAFASELKPIMRMPEFKKEIRRELVASYLVHNVIASPNTVFKDTYKVEPGQYVIYENANIKSGYYYKLIEKAKNAQGDIICDFGEAKRGLNELLLDSVSKRMISDVPVGTFLSGGIDSTLVTSLVKEVTDRKVDTFTIGFENKKDNEAVYAKEISEYLGTNHTELYVSTEDLFEQIRDIAVYYDEPFSDSSQIPSMLVSKLAKQDVTVVLTGDGGDELFCGYEEYDSIRMLQKLDGLGGFANGVLNLPVIRKAGIVEKLPYKYRGLLQNRDKRFKTQVVLKERERIAGKLVAGNSYSVIRDFESEISENKILADDWLLRRMILDMRYYLADEVLQKVDRASMRYSLEVRCPILDCRIVDYSFKIPMDYKYHNKEKKYILKQLAYDYVPKEMLDRPKKGFSIPIKNWLISDLSEQLKRYADRDILLRQNIFNPLEINEIIEKMKQNEWWYYVQLVWAFFMFQVWYQTYVEDLWSV